MPSTIDEDNTIAILVLTIKSKPIIDWFFISALSERLTIKRSESFNYHASYSSDKAHDGKYEHSRYSPKDNAMAGNFLKLYLSKAYSIGNVIMFSRPGKAYAERMENTEVRVYSTVGGENNLASCGKITGESCPK